MSESTPYSIAPTVLRGYLAFVESRKKPMEHITSDIHHMATGIATEAGELLSTSKKMWVYGQNLHSPGEKGQTLRTNLIEEMGDVLYYVQGLCNILGVSLLDVIVENQVKLTKRYPTGYSDAAAAFRADKQDPNAACEEK